MNRYRWATLDDLNAFFGLALDNVANLVLTVGLLQASFEFPASFALHYMIPGTALGVLVGDACFFWMALRLAQRTGRDTVTAMPLAPVRWGWCSSCWDPLSQPRRNEA